MNRKIQILLLLLLLAAWGCTDDPVAPTSAVSIRGLVFEQVTEAPVFDARVTILNTSDFTDTDSLGQFQFDSLSFRESFSLRVEKPGFQDQTVSVAFDEGGLLDRELEIPLNLDLSDNTPPEIPTLISPPNGATEVSSDVTLVWASSDPDTEDQLSYEVLVSDNFSLETQTYTTTDTFLNLHDLKFNNVYYWQVLASDGVNEAVASLGHTFRTVSNPEDFRVHFVRRDAGTNNFVIFAGERPDDSSDPDSLEVFPLTEPNRSCWRPHLSLEANRIAYIAFDGTEPHLYTMDRSGTDHRKVTSSKPITSVGSLVELNYTWSPNGGQLLYPHNDKLYLINENGSGLAEFASAPTGYFFMEVDWSSENVIAARVQSTDRNASKILILDIQGNLVSTPVDDSVDMNWLAGPVLSIGSEYFIYVKDQVTSDEETPQFTQLLLKNTAGSTPITPPLEVNDGTVPENTNDLYPAIPPGGQKVLFVNRPSDNSSIGDIYLMPIFGSGSSLRQLIFRNATMPDWQ